MSKLKLTVFVASTAAQNILLYQRLTKVMAKLTYGVEVEMQRHMDNLELRVKKAGDAVQGLEPDLDRLQLKLAKLTAHFNNDLQHTVQRSGDSITKGQKGAENLQHLLAVMIQTVLDGTSQVAAAQVKSVELADQGKNDINSWVAVMEAAASSAHNLNSRIVCTYGASAWSHAPWRLIDPVNNRNNLTWKSKPLRSSKTHCPRT